MSRALVDGIDRWLEACDGSETPVAVSLASEVSLALADFWTHVSTTPGSPFATRAIAYPSLSLTVQEAAQLQFHIDLCAEVCDILGPYLRAQLVHPDTVPEGEVAPPCMMLVLETTVDLDLLNELIPGHAASSAAAPAGGDASAEEVLAVTKQWVEALIVHAHVCPYAVSADRAGLPSGGVSYPILRTDLAEDVYAEFWMQVYRMSKTEQRELSTVLLVTPEFGMHSPGSFDQFSDTLEQAITLLNLDDSLMLVFFHPQYTFRQLKGKVGGPQAPANYARRSPWPMINILRAEQVAAAQKGIPTGSVYQVNADNMARIDSVELQRMLDARDWGQVHACDKFQRHSADHRSSASEESEDRPSSGTAVGAIAMAGNSSIDNPS